MCLQLSQASPGEDMAGAPPARPQQQEVLEPSAVWQTAWEEFERAASQKLSTLQAPRKL